MNVNINRWDVLTVNRAWQVLGTTTIRNAVKSLFSTSDEITMAAKAFNIEYQYLGENRWNFENPITIREVILEEWLELPVRPFDNFISTAKRKIRIPTVIMAVNCEDNRLRPIKLNTRNILERDGYVCQYSGRKLSPNQLNIDHIIPRSRGGKDTWENMVACEKKLNGIKNDKTPEEAGLKLIKKPKAPLPVPAEKLIKEIRFKDWEIFLHK